MNIITSRTAEDSVKGVGALPLLSYTLDDMWTQMVKRGDGVLRLPAQSFELGGVLSDRADAFLARHPKSLDELRRIFTLKLATVREGEEPTRRRALRSEFSDEEWRLVSELADHPNRLLVTATPESGDTYAEVAHEAIFRRWHKLRDWIAAEREFLAWRTGLEAARRAWLATPDSTQKQALLMGLALAQGQVWLERRSDGIPKADRDFIVLSRNSLRRQRRRGRAFVGLATVFLLPLFSTLAWMVYHFGARAMGYLKVRADRGGRASIEAWATLSRNRASRVPGDGGCAGGQLHHGVAGKRGRPPRRRGSTAQGDHPPSRRSPSASLRSLLNSSGNACYGHQGMLTQVSLLIFFAHSRAPVRNVSWGDVKLYVAWLTRVTGNSYRLLTEAEWEYAARADQPERFSFGDDEAKLGEYGWYRDNSGGSPQPVGQKKPNGFGLYDTHGNVSEWVEDCYKALTTRQHQRTVRH